jgi:uncharacterized protein (DUF885 family)
MRALSLLLVPIAFALASCATAPSTADADARFKAHSAQVLEEMWAEFPDFGIHNGNYKYADRMNVPDAARRNRSTAFYQRQLGELARFDPASLDPSHRIELVILKGRFERSLWELQTFRSWQWQPSTYNVANEIDLLLTTEYAPLETRLRHVMARLERIPAYYAAAAANIADPTLEHTQLAILQNRGALTVLGPELAKTVEGSPLGAADKALFAQRLEAARAAINEYISYCGVLEARLKSGRARSFRIGKELYEQKFHHDIQSGFTAAELYKRAMAEKTALHESMEKLARQVWPKYMGNAPMPSDRLVLIRNVMDELSKRHVARDDFVPAVRRQIAELQAFVRAKDLVDQDASRPLIVRETPQYLRGIAGASISAPGPLNPTANTYYNVTPLDHMGAEEAESFLREYNDWTLQILNIHEAIPGHYTQLMHANKSPSLVKSVFANGSMIEGWAVFGEKVMLDAGYDGGTPEIWLSWMKWNLRTVMNTILDYEIQTQGLERDAAMRYMTYEAFQQQAEASEKWRRATLTQVQLTSYYNGYAEIRALRDEMRAKQGAAFSVKGFNNRFLSYGNAPVRLIRELMVAAP